MVALGAVSYSDAVHNPTEKCMGKCILLLGRVAKCTMDDVFLAMKITVRRCAGGLTVILGDL
jgi:hypothetical protein